jgi:hypothetical protein
MLPILAPEGSTIKLSEHAEALKLKLLDRVEEYFFGAGSWRASACVQTLSCSVRNGIIIALRKRGVSDMVGLPFFEKAHLEGVFRERHEPGLASTLAIESVAPVASGSRPLKRAAADVIDLVSTSDSEGDWSSDDSPTKFVKRRKV